MTNKIDCTDEYELKQLKDDVIEQGYRYITLGLKLYFWRN